MRELQDFGLAQLARQIGFIERACRDYDSGHRDAALHIALACRVLFHNTRKQTCLFSKLGWLDVTMLSTTKDPERQATSSLSGLAIPLLGGEPYQVPFLGANPRCHRRIPWGRWWDEVVYGAHLGSLTRRDLITIAADKEVAHADEQLPAIYAILKRGIWEVTSDAGRTTKVVEVQLADLRQIGFEVLHSDLRTQLSAV